jgi:L-fuculokinase
MLTAVVDIGKTHARLALVRPTGEVVAWQRGPSASCATAGGWRALDTQATEQWLFDSLCATGALRADIDRLIVTTHGAAVAALQGERLALPVADYEEAAFDERPSATLAALDAFDATLSPVLPRGLNLGLQLDWLQRHEAAALARADTLLPYPQYWGWRFSGVRASEVSSLGCHTLLWQPGARRYADWATARGWASRFAPLRSAWEVLGPVVPALGRRLGLRPDVQIHVGVHDSNACLARWLRHWPRHTLVSTGTWVVVMAPGASTGPLDPQADELGNVSVCNDVVPTARFMGGRELAVLCDGADPALADSATLQALLQRGLQVLPSFETQGGPFRHHAGSLVDARGPVVLATLTPTERATAAAHYGAQMIARTVQRLRGLPPVVLEGPFARNPVIREVLAALLPADALWVPGDEAGTDALDGTVHGCLQLAHWLRGPLPATQGQAVRATALAGAVQAAHRDWLRRLPPQSPLPSSRG